MCVCVCVSTKYFPHCCVIELLLVLHRKVHLLESFYILLLWPVSLFEDHSVTVYALNLYTTLIATINQHAVITAPVAYNKHIVSRG